MKFQQLQMNPAKNPAVLDTATWDIVSVEATFKRLPGEYLEQLVGAAIERRELPADAGLTPYNGSLSHKNGGAFFLAGLPDGQQIFIEAGPSSQISVLGIPLLQIPVKTGNNLRFYKTDAAVVHRFFRNVLPQKGSLALGQTPRLGIGVRMTTACWPGILKAMAQKGFAANIIQNSVRELNFLTTLLEAKPAEINYACGFGAIETGYTGSSFEGLWVSGVLAALKYPTTLPYGADADHLQVKRSPEGLARAKKYIDSCRYYSFYTLDMADILDYAALREKSDAAALGIVERKIADANSRREVLQYHQGHGKAAGKHHASEPAMLARLIGKYWDSLAVIEELTAYLNQIKKGEPYDLEFTIDEHPPEIGAFECLTTEAELRFVLMEIKRRGLPVSHIAPNFGAEKGWDYRGADGLEGLAQRIVPQFRIAEEFGAMLDFHSADDLTAPVRRVIQKSTGGRHHYKISPMVQLLFAATLKDFHADLFRQWWNDALDYARREAAAGSDFARQCVAVYEAAADQAPSHRHMVFHHYSFAFVGRRDINGQFLHREKFYDLSPAFYREYENRLFHYLMELTDELF